MEKFVDKYKHVVKKSILREMFEEIILDFKVNQDIYFCIKCLKYLGCDMPEGIGCNECFHFYCESCDPKICCGKKLDDSNEEDDCDNDSSKEEEIID